MGVTAKKPHQQSCTWISNEKASYFKNKHFLQHKLVFATIYTPFTVKNMTLLFKQSSLYHSSLSKKPLKKVLVKQSYVLLMWVSYLSLKNTRKSFTVSCASGTNNVNNEKNSDTPKLRKRPSLFIKPFRNYKTTITRAPMAHKTFSQEQFMVRYYRLNLSFTTSLFKKDEFPKKLSIDLNSSFYFALKLKLVNPLLSTNMLMLHNYRIYFIATDLQFTTIF